MPDPEASDGYDINVFINCPFDDTYTPLFRVLIFTIFACGYRPRCALEVNDASRTRIEKILDIIQACRRGIHDISRTDLTLRGLPRFNMPLELGLFLGARRFGTGKQKRKSCLVFDRERYRFQEFISDIAGQDITAHDDRPELVIAAVRDWLAAEAAPGIAHLPGGAAIREDYQRFAAELPMICGEARLRVDELTFADYADFASTWLTEDRKTRSGTTDQTTRK